MIPVTNNLIEALKTTIGFLLRGLLMEWESRNLSESISSD